MSGSRQRFHRAVYNSLAGMLATAPMTAVMAAGRAAAPPEQQYALEPWRVTTEVLRRLGLRDALTDAQKTQWGWLMHLGYGAALGAVFPAGQHRSQCESILRGAGFGLAVFAASYAGWLPMARLQPPLRKRPMPRNLALLAAHLTWGISLGLGASYSSNSPRPA